MLWVLQVDSTLDSAMFKKSDFVLEGTIDRSNQILSTTKKGSPIIIHRVKGSESVP